MREIEAEFDEPIADVIRIMRHEQGQTLDVIAGALGITRSTLRVWMATMSIDRGGRRRPMREYLLYRRHPRHDALQERCRALYGADLDLAIPRLRTQGLSHREIAAQLGCHRATVLRYMPPGLRDGRKVLSDAERRRRAAAMRDVNARGLNAWRRYRQCCP